MESNIVSALSGVNLKYNKQLEIEEKARQEQLRKDNFSNSNLISSLDKNEVQKESTVVDTNKKLSKEKIVKEEAKSSVKEKQKTLSNTGNETTSTAGLGILALIYSILLRKKVK